MTAIQIDIQHKTYRNQQQHRQPPVIENLHLTLEAHQFVCLVGRSGCGKTTLLNTIAGLDRDFVGQIQIGSLHTPAKIGYVFQNPRLLPWRTVRQNLELVLEKTQSADLIDSLLEQMQLTAVQHVYPAHLSLGMSRRVAIIRAFAVNPDVLLMDEPFVSLDAPTVREIRALLLKLWLQRPHTVLFVTHDLREAIALADKLVFLTPPPMQILQEVTVPIARNQRSNESLIEEFRRRLLTEHTEIQALL